MSDSVAPARGGVRLGRLNLANLVTSTRAVLVLLAAFLVLMVHLMTPGLEPVRTVPLWLLALPAWALDLLDGYLARRMQRATRFGAHFDEETDALLILVLSLALAPLAPWALVIGLAHYGVLLLRLTGSRWRAPLPPRGSRKVIAATVGGILVWSVLPWIPEPVAQLAVGVGVVLIVWSFGRDLWWLARRPAR